MLLVVVVVTTKGNFVLTHNCTYDGPLPAEVKRDDSLPYLECGASGADIEVEKMEGGLLIVATRHDIA